MSKRPFRVTQIDLKGSEAVLLIPPALPCVLFGPNVVALFTYVFGIVAGMCALAWLIKNRPDLFRRET